MKPKFKKNQNATSCLNPFSNATGGRRPEPGLGRGRCMATTNIGHELFSENQRPSKGSKSVSRGEWLLIVGSNAGRSKVNASGACECRGQYFRQLVSRWGWGEGGCCGV